MGRLITAVGMLRALWRDERGATAIEYAIIAGGVALVIASAVTALGGSLGNKYQSVSDVFK